MAIFVANSPRFRCPFCDQPFVDDKGVRGLPAFQLADDDPELQRLSDRCVHQACLDAWPRREEFVARYNQSLKGTLIEQSRALVMTDEGRVEEQRDRGHPKS